MMRKILLCILAVYMAMTSVKANKLDLLKVAEFRVGSEYCTSSDSLNYVFAIKGDSVVVDEIVLAVGNKNKASFEVKEDKSSLVKFGVRNNMTTGEMKDKAFTLKVGHSYEITWGQKKWWVTLIKKQPDVADLMVLNDTTIQIKKQGGLLNKAGEAFILSDSLITISSIGFDKQYMGDSLIITVAGKDSICMVYEGKIVKLEKPFQLLKSQNYAIILKKDNKIAKAFAIGEPKKPILPIWWIIGIAMVQVIIIAAVFLFFIRRKTKMSETHGKPEKLDIDNFLAELIGERPDFDLNNKRACLDELKHMLDEYDAVKILFQNFETELEDKDLKGTGLKEKLEEFVNKYKSLQQLMIDDKGSNGPEEEKPYELSFAERLNLIGEDDESDINKFVLKQLETAGFKDIDCSKVKYADYLKEMAVKLAEKSADEETLKNKVCEKLKQQGLDLKSLADADVKQALESVLLRKLNDANFEGTTVEEVFNKIKEKIEEIKKKEADIDTMQDEIESKDVKIANLNGSIDHMKQQLTNIFFNDLDALKEACNEVFLVPGTHTSEADCMAVENCFLNHLKKNIEQLKNVELVENVLPMGRYDEIQRILEAELRNVDSTFNSICRYYAYSRIPFMADDIEYGKKFRRNAMFKLFDVFDKLLTDFGLQVIIPHLFVDTLVDGRDRYEDYTGQKDAYSDLNNLCPNVKYRKEYVDCTDKSRLIYDIIAVGYSINGKVLQKAKVLI